MDNMATAYLETTIPSYLTSRPSRDLVVSAHQQLTHEWWAAAREDVDLFVSEAVLEEIRIGDPEVAARRLRIIEGLPLLEVNEEAGRLAAIYARRLGLHGAAADILHIAVAVAYKLDYLVTWNCKHIANAQVIHRLMIINQELEMATPVIATPEFLLDVTKGDDK
jgi:predicted nucleic acid-binding protein